MKKPNENITNADIAFGPMNLGEFLPNWKSIPDDFKNDKNHFVKFVSNWFYNGVKEYPVSKDGINFKLATAHIRVILSSFEPKHEHKIAGAAYLASLWFTTESTK